MTVASQASTHGGGMQGVLRAGIVWYQRLREGRPSPCRFFPTCSSYALEAVEVHGAGRGSWLAVRRLLRCRPLGPSGFDPVPLPHIHEPAEPADAAHAADRSSFITIPSDLEAVVASPPLKGSR